METADNITISPQQKIDPTSSQLERAAAIKRFNTLYIYLPIGFGAFLVVGIVILLLIAVLSSPELQTLLTVSAVADIVVIAWIIPTMIACAIVPSLFIFLTVQGRQRGSAPIRQLQLLLWRADNILWMVHEKVNDIVPRVANPFIRAHAVAAFVSALFKNILRIFSRS
jgi:hypothetical protein